MKAALYVRVSTEMQVEDGFSISAQINLLNEYCQKNSIEVFKLYSDEGLSGQKENRPQFQQMIKDAEKKLFNIILVHKFDRFARKVELSQRIKLQLKKSGVNVISITEPVENSPIGFFTEGIMELLGEYFVRDLAIRTKMGHVERASQGQHNGSVPYGYKLDKITGNMEIEPDQAEVVKSIFDMYVNKGYGSTKIAKLLNWSEIPSAVKGQWAHFTVNRVLKNVKYIGKIEYDGKIYPGCHPAIIDEATFELTQRYRTERTWKREYRGYHFNQFLFLGLLRCGECGRMFRLQPGKFSKKNPHIKRYYYKCNAAGRSDKQICDFRKSFPVDSLENALIEFIKKHASGMSANFKIREKSKGAEFLLDRKTVLKTELERATQAYLKGVFTLEEFAPIKARCEKEINELSKTQPSEDLSKALSNKIKSVWDEFEACETIAEKKGKLKSFIDCVYIFKDRIEVNYFL